MGVLLVKLVMKPAGITAVYSVIWFNIVLFVYATLIIIICHYSFILSHFIRYLCHVSVPRLLPCAEAFSPSLPPFSGCEHESRLSMWIYVFLGNILRGIGETPVQPLGISYIDDHALEENAAFYIGTSKSFLCIYEAGLYSLILHDGHK